MTPTVVDLGNLSVESLLFFGGVYSNFEALQALQERVKKDYDSVQVFCTGDIPAYCSAPAECVNEVIKWNIVTVAGNVERQLALNAKDCGCGFEVGSTCDTLSEQWFSFVDSKISEDQRRWMLQLPDHVVFSYRGKRFLVVHGSPDAVSEFVWYSTPWEKKSEFFDKHHVDVIVCGHSGLPSLESRGGKVWFNAGVIGMPANDGTSRTWFGSCTQEGKELVFKLHALEYEAGKVAAHMHELELPKEYCESLISGLWSSVDILPPLELNEAGVPLIEYDIRIAYE